LLIVEADASAGLSALHLANWPGAARRLLEAPVRAAGPDARALLALPEAGLAASEARVWAEHRDGHLSPARIRIASARPAPTGDGPCHERRVSVVVTSCGRQDLLGKTLDSFFACNTYPIAQIIIVEDGPAEANASLARKYDGRNITWLATGRQSGQIAAIDFAYAFVETPYIFHLEDDWQFYQAGFIEKSLVILEAVPACLQVWIRAFNDTNRQPIAAETETVDGVACRKILAYLDKWHGFSFNPGLRRTGDYDRIGQYGWHVRYDRADPDASEWRLSALYKEMGFYAVILADDGGKGYVRHLGFGRRVVDRGAVSR
jgi:glycosyltransferase involved in cell wall biosynthesis